MSLSASFLGVWVGATLGWFEIGRGAGEAARVSVEHVANSGGCCTPLLLVDSLVTSRWNAGRRARK